MKIKKLLSCILALLFLFGGTVTLFSCNKEDVGEQESETVEAPVESGSGSAETGSETEALKLVENGKSEYVVVYPNDASSAVLGAVDLLIQKIEEKTGVTLKSKSDNLRGAASHDPNEKAILIGRTNYEESQAVLDTLGRFEYKIVQVGNKMVVSALDDAYVVKAIKYYNSNLLSPNITGEEGARTLVLEEYHYIPEGIDRNSCKINGTDISKFSIVYPKNDVEYKKIADTLQSVVLSKMGVELPVYSDAEKEHEHEILLGKTARSFSQSLYSDLQKYVMTYSLEVSGSKLQILSGGCFSARQCIIDMQYGVLADGEVNLTDGSHEKEKVLSNPTELTDGADLRILCANLLHSEWAGNRQDVVCRAEAFAGVLLDYQPDAVGIQELNDRWKTELEKWLTVLKEEYGLEYTLHHKSTPKKSDNYITILYRSDKYDCVEEDIREFPHNDSNCVTMCRLQSKTDSQKEFIMMNTHWDVDTWEGARKDICSEESTAFVNEWKSAGIPIFFTGDWNATRGRDCLEDFITATEAQTADEGQTCIEWTFYWGENVTAKKNEKLGQYGEMTDHPLRYTDFDLSW
ncbi:MAG: hypothetical protein E7668_07365 [Ruminococcaceae bacterium]|nr:hypothetical protein [Oscillospiraceae bacterium]